MASPWPLINQLAVLYLTLSIHTCMYNTGTHPNKYSPNQITIASNRVLDTYFAINHLEVHVLALPWPLINHFKLYLQHNYYISYADNPNYQNQSTLYCCTLGINGNWRKLWEMHFINICRFRNLAHHYYRITQTNLQPSAAHSSDDCKLNDIEYQAKQSHDQSH